MQLTFKNQAVILGEVFYNYFLIIASIVYE